MSKKPVQPSIAAEMRETSRSGSTITVSWYVQDIAAVDERARQASMAERERLAQHCRAFEDSERATAAWRAAEGYYAAVEAAERATAAVREADAELRQLWESGPEDAILKAEGRLLESRQRLDLARRRAEMTRALFAQRMTEGRAAAKTWPDRSGARGEIYSQLKAAEAAWKPEDGLAPWAEIQVLSARLGVWAPGQVDPWATEQFLPDDADLEERPTRASRRASRAEA